jgi:hypothetical protein
MIQIGLPALAIAAVVMRVDAELDDEVGTIISYLSDLVLNIPA